MSKSNILAVALAACAGLFVGQMMLQHAVAQATRAAALELAQEQAANIPKHSIVNANALTVSASSVLELVADQVIPGTNRPAGYDGFSCILPSGTDVDTAAEGVYVVDAGDANTNDGYGPFCNDSSACLAGGIIRIDAKKAYLRKAGGADITIQCGFGLP